MRNCLTLTATTLEFIKMHATSVVGWLLYLNLAITVLLSSYPYDLGNFIRSTIMFVQPTFKVY